MGRDRQRLAVDERAQHVVTGWEIPGPPGEVVLWAMECSCRRWRMTQSQDAHQRAADAHVAAANARLLEALTKVERLKARQLSREAGAPRPEQQRLL